MFMEHVQCTHLTYIRKLYTFDFIGKENQNKDKVNLIKRLLHIKLMQTSAFFLGNCTIVVIKQNK